MNNNTPKHVQLLELLEKKGIGVEANVSDFMDDNFSKPSTSIKSEYDKAVRPPILFIKDLYNRGYIDNDSNSVEKGWYNISYPFYADHIDEAKWYTDFETNVFITSIGLDYLENYRDSQINKKLAESYIDVNIASKRNYRNQIIIGLITIGLAGASCYMSYQSNHKSDTTAISVDSLRLEIRKWRTQKI